MQWQKYERKVAERVGEQQSALSRSAGLLDSMRQRFATPGTAAGAGDPLLATPRAELAGPPGTALASSAAPPGSATAATAAWETPRTMSGGSLKENQGAELNRGPASVAALFSSGGGVSSAFGAAALNSGGGAGGGDGSLLQQASNMFLQQVEDMRRKYTAEVEHLKVGGWV